MRETMNLKVPSKEARTPDRDNLEGEVSKSLGQLRTSPLLSTTRGLGRTQCRQGHELNHTTSILHSTGTYRVCKKCRSGANARRRALLAKWEARRP